MRLDRLLPLLMLIGFVALFTGCHTAGERTASSGPLSAACTLWEMSPAERSAHERRLTKLRDANRFERETARGFEFSVDLREMSAQDVGLWMENEQKCCSFLRLSQRTDEPRQRSYVSVECPANLRAEIKATFGIRAKSRAKFR